jgi:peptidoglycan hydrolase-like protein with peptidoglycan-binding domain
MKTQLAAAFFAVLLAAVPAMAADRNATVKQTQQVLKDKGYYDGPIDGIIGPKTRAGLRQYQKEASLPVTGRFTRETAQKMDVVDASTSPADYFENAGDAIGSQYSKGGKAVSRGSKDMAADVKDGEITAGAVDFGKGIGKGAKHVGVGTKDATVSAAKGTADGAEDVADKAGDLGKAGYKKSKKAVEKSADAVKDAFDGKNEEHPKR